MNRHYEYDFCMKQFKPAIGVLAVLLVIVIGWTGYHCVKSPKLQAFELAAAATPPARTLNVKDKMLHPYWGNCNKCHITMGAGAPISQVMAGPPISVKQTMTHKYWGNCLLCHKVTDGFQAPAPIGAKRQGGNGNAQAKAAAFNRLTGKTLGLELQSVTAQVMQKFGLANEDGVLVLSVARGSIAEKAGFRQGDEIILMANQRLDTVNDFERVLSTSKPNTTLKFKVYRKNRTKNIYIPVPSAEKGTAVQAAATNTPMTQNQVETLAEQLGVPKTSQAVNQALQKQKQARLAAVQQNTPQQQLTQNQVETMAEQFGVPKTNQAVNQALQKQKQTQLAAAMYRGKAAVASSGTMLSSPVAAQFGKAPFFIIYDPANNSYSAAKNPNANDFTGHAVQTAQLMVDLGVSNVISGNFEPDAVNTLHTLRVNIFAGVYGTCQNILSAYISNRLIPVSTYSASQTNQTQTQIQAQQPAQPMAAANQFQPNILVNQHLPGQQQGTIY